MLDKDMTLGDYQAMLNRKVTLVNEEGAVIVKEAILECLSEDLKSYLVRIDGVRLLYNTDTVKLVPIKAPCYTATNEEIVESIEGALRMLKRRLTPVTKESDDD